MEEFYGSFEATPDGKLIPDNKDLFRRYLIENTGHKLLGQFNHEANTSEKERMYNYFHGPFLSAYISAMEHAGYQGITKPVAEDILKKLYAFEYYHNPLTLQREKRLLSKRDFSKKRMLKFLKDCITHLEMDLEWEAPDSEHYLKMEA